MKSTRYNTIPFRIGLKGIPQIADNDPLKNSGAICAEGISTLPTSIDEANERSQAMLRHVRNRIRHGDHQALVNLLDDHPEFSAHAWVRQELIKWRRSGRSFRKRGRTRGSVTFHPIVIAGVVSELKKRDLTDTNERAFEWLARTWPISYDTARSKYYQARREERFKAVLIEDPISATLRSAEEIEETVDEAELLEPGKEIKRTVETPGGVVKIAFQGH